MASSTLFKFLSGPPSSWPPSVFIFGPAQSGKTRMLEDVINATEFSSSGAASCVVSCVQGAVQPRIVLQEIVRKLLGGDDEAAAVSNLSDLAHALVRNRDRLSGGVVVALKNAERLRDMDANLLPGFLRLAELTSMPVCAVLLSKISWSKFHVPSGLTRPVPVAVRQFTKEQMSVIIAEKLKASQMERDESVSDDIKRIDWTDQFFQNYASLVIGIFFTAVRTLPQLDYLCSKHFASYRDPVARGEIEQHNVRSLYRVVEKELKESLSTLHLQETTSKQLMALQRREADDGEMTEAAPVKQNRRLHVELPFHSKFLLIASYLASYNPVKADKRFFVKHHGKQRKTKATIKAKARAAKTQLTGPKAFPLDRMMAIFYSIVDEEVAPSANIQSQIATLVTLQFLMAVGSDDVLDQPKYKCNVGLDFISQMSRQVNFEVHRYLYDFA
jgi:origin recognition complex subunit 5